MPVIRALSTASPSHRVDQIEARDFARRLFADDPMFFQRMAGVDQNAGIDTRRMCVPLSWFEQPHGWTDRNAPIASSATRTT